MPKFDINNERYLASDLKAMGITEVFKQSANFSPITGSDNLPLFSGVVAKP